MRWAEPVGACAVAGGLLPGPEDPALVPVYPPGWKQHPLAERDPDPGRLGGVRGGHPLDDLAAVTGGLGHARHRRRCGHRSGRCHVRGGAVWTQQGCHQSVAAGIRHRSARGARGARMAAAALRPGDGCGRSRAALHGIEHPAPAGGAGARQVFAAGLLTSLVGALFVTVAGMATTALMLNAAWLRNWLYHGRGGGGGPPGPEPTPHPPDGGQLAGVIDGEAFGWHVRPPRTRLGHQPGPAHGRPGRRRRPPEPDRGTGGRRGRAVRALVLSR